MRHFQISILITALFLCSISCRESIGEQHKSLPKENTPSSEQKKIQKDSSSEPIKTLQDKNLKKKKKASDTLRPKMAVL